MDAFKVVKSILLFLLFVLLSIDVFYLVNVLARGVDKFFYPETAASVSENFQPERMLDKNVETVIQPKRELTINAESVISVRVLNGQQHVLFSKNDQEKLLIASLTKLMTAVVSLENYDLLQNVKISKEAVAQGGFFKTGEIFPVKTLLYAALVGSDNSAAYALSELMGKGKFVNLMNLKAKDIGLLNTYYSNSVGFGLKNHSTTEDLVGLAKYIVEKHPLIFQITLIPEFTVYDLDGNFHHKVLTTNQLLTNLSFNWRSAILGSKTGNNKEAGECLVLVLKSPDGKGYFINAILNSKDRFEEMKKLIDWVNANYK